MVPTQRENLETSPEFAFFCVFLFVFAFFVGPCFFPTQAKKISFLAGVLFFQPRRVITSKTYLGPTRPAENEASARPIRGRTRRRLRSSGNSSVPRCISSSGEPSGLYSCWIMFLWVVFCFWFCSVLGWGCNKNSQFLASAYQGLASGVLYFAVEVGILFECLI